MGDLHNELRRGPLGPALTRALGLTRGTEGLERVGETLQPVIDLYSLPEWAYLRREWLLSGVADEGATAAEYSATAIINPTGANNLVIVEAISVYATGQNNFRLIETTAAIILATLLTAAGRGLSRDTRSVDSPGLAQLWTGSDAGIVAAAQLEKVSQPASGITGFFQIGLPFVIKPGWGLVVETATLNLAISTCYRWRERRALPGELE